MVLKRLVRLAAFAALASNIISPAAAREFPSRPITLIVPYAAGGTTDILARALADALARDLKQAVVVENKPGANGTLGVVTMKAARPDGHTLTVVPLSVFRQPYIQNVAYDPIKDLKYVSMVAGYDFAIAVNAKSPWKTIQELVDYTKKNPDQVFYGVSARYSMNEFIMMDLAKKANLKWTSVPFKGDAESINNLLGGQIPVAAVANTILPYVQSGHVRLLASAGEKRWKEFPGVPTLKESGYPVVANSPLGIAGPAGMPDSLVTFVDGAISRAVKDPKFAEVASRFSIGITYMGHQAYTSYATETVLSEKDAVKTMLDGAVKEGGGS
jgi:tripartite-type tricarboxylate transporter receptor subunit TctC